MSCQEDLVLWWIPENIPWAQDDEPMAGKSNVRYLLASLNSVYTFEQTTCLYCDANDHTECAKRTTRPHKNRTFKDVTTVVPNLDLLFYDAGGTDFKIHVANFYDLESHDGSKRMPLDCRSCAFYQTHKCMPLIEALDDMTETVNYNTITDPQDAMMCIEEYRIVPCRNFVLSDGCLFRSLPELREWVASMELYYEELKRNGIDFFIDSYNTSSKGTHIFREFSANETLHQHDHELDLFGALKTLDEKTQYNEEQNLKAEESVFNQDYDDPDDWYDDYDWINGHPTERLV